jgi:hypothetical protein
VITRMEFSVHTGVLVASDPRRSRQSALVLVVDRQRLATLEEAKAQAKLEEVP